MRSYLECLRPVYLMGQCFSPEPQSSRVLREEHAGGAAVEGFGLVAQEYGWLFA